MVGISVPTTSLWNANTFNAFIDFSQSCSYGNLFLDYNDFIPPSDQLLLLLHALGGSSVPDILLTSICSPQRRWSDDGEMKTVTAVGLDLPAGLLGLLSNKTVLDQAMSSSYITKHVLDSGTVSWSLCPNLVSFFSNTLRPQTIDELRATALRVICFSCPPCYEGNTDWYDWACRLRCSGCHLAY